MLLLALLAGCSGGGSEPEPSIAAMYRSRIDQVLENSPSKLEKAVFADYRVTDAEYQQARAELKKCVEAAPYGFVVTLQPTQTSIEWPAGLSESMGGDAAAQTVVDTTMRDCEQGTTFSIEPVYLGMRDNPEGLSNVQLIRQCFDREGITHGKDLTDEEFQTEVVQNDTYLNSDKQAWRCVWEQ